MSADQSPARRPPGFFECRRAIERLTRFRDLIIQRQRWAPYITLARPLEELLPNLDPQDGPREIDRAISHLTPLVARDLWRMDIDTDFTFPKSRPEIDDDTRKIRHRDVDVDLIKDFFRLPHDDPYGRAFDLVFHALEQGIGAYTERKKRAALEKLNPLRWLAGILRAPIFVLEEAGYLTEKNRLALGILKVLWPTALVVFGWVLAKYGIKFPVREILRPGSP
jgi:hypothetical protein